MKKQHIVIIGAGSTGLSTALEIAKDVQDRPIEITVVDKGYVGSGQTSKSCGFVRTFYNSPQMIVSARYSMGKIKELCATAPNLTFVQTGLLVLDRSANRPHVRQNVALLQAHGLASSYLEGADISALNPFLTAQDTCAGYDAGAGYVDPQLVVNFLEHECLRLGVTILEQTTVEDIARQGGRFHLTTSQGALTADTVFNATAGYTNTLNRMLGFELPVRTIAVNNTFYRLPAGPSSYPVAIADFVHGFYAIPRADFLDVSALTLDTSRTIDPTTEPAPPFDPATTQEFLSLLARRIPEAKRASSLGGFGSHIDVTPDYYPILGAIDAIPRYFCAAGFSGTGFKHFPMIGRLMKELILGQEPSYPDVLSFLRHDRFAEHGVRHDVSDSYFYFVKE